MCHFKFNELIPREDSAPVEYSPAFVANDADYYLELV